MPEASFGLFLFIVILAVGFGLVNGFNDAANAIAASIGSRSLSPRTAIIIAAIFNLAGAATGLAVARTIGKGILIPEERLPGLLSYYRAGTKEELCLDFQHQDCPPASLDQE